MAYTPINWQTGDTITAEKLNRCDNGWGTESTELFSETVTTVAGSDGNSAELFYDEPINADTVTVTFDGTDYECDRIDFGSNRFYGGFSTSPVGPDFTSYPFFIMNAEDSSTLYTDTAGTHTVAVAASAIVTSNDFSTAVNSCIDAQDFPYLLVSVMDGGTDQTWGDIYDAFTSGAFCVVGNYGPVLQMWDDGSRCYMATGGTSPQNGKFDPAIWRTAGASSDLPLAFYKYDSQMP